LGHKLLTCSFQFLSNIHKSVAFSYFKKFSSIREKKLIIVLNHNVEDFILNNPDRHGNHCSGILQWWRKIGLSSRCSKGTWEFTAEARWRSVGKRLAIGNVR
jgi:hypothetical protein